jgi:hypothetical protein
MKLVTVQKSTRANKKYQAIFEENGKQIIRHFGSRGMSDFTINKDPVRKDLYLQRHQAREDWNDPKTAGSLARWILWNKPSLSESITDFKRRFNL